MDAWRPPTPSQLRRLVEELAEAGLDLDGSAPWHDLAIEEIAYAIRPKVHERYVPSYGAMIEPTTDPAEWRSVTGLVIERGPLTMHPDSTHPPLRRRHRQLADAPHRRHQRVGHPRPARRLRARRRRAGRRPRRHHRAAPPHRHRAGRRRLRRVPLGRPGLAPRAAGRRTGSTTSPASTTANATCCTALLEFAVHDLGARGIGAILVYRADESLTLSHELRLTDPAEAAHHLADGPRPAAPRPGPDRRRRPLRRRGRAPADRRAPGAHHRGRGRRRRLQGHAPHRRPPLQLRRPRAPP